MLLRWLTGYFVSLAVMPSQFLGEYDTGSTTDWSDVQQREGVTITNHQVDSTNAAKIDFSEIHQNKKFPKAKDQKVIIHAVGNGDFYENHMRDYVRLAKKYPSYKMVGFNFRGTVASKGRAWSENDWIDDCIAVIEHYRKQGIATENILLNGHSMGGAITTMAAAKLYLQDVAKAKKANRTVKDVKSVKLINNRSFSNLADEIIVSLLGKSASAAITGILYGSLIGLIAGFSMLASIAVVTAALFATLYTTPMVVQNLLYPWMNGLLWLTFGTMDAASAYKSLPEGAVDHIVAKHDAVIQNKAGLHHALKSRNTARKKQLRDIIQQEKNPAKVKAAEAELLNLKDSKVRYSDNPAHGFEAHNADLNMLSTYHKLRARSAEDKLPQQLSAEDVMDNKIQRLFKAKA